MFILIIAILGSLAMVLIQRAKDGRAEAGTLLFGPGWALVHVTLIPLGLPVTMIACFFYGLFFSQLVDLLFGSWTTKTILGGC